MFLTTYGASCRRKVRSRPAVPERRAWKRSRGHRVGTGVRLDLRLPQPVLDAPDVDRRGPWLLPYRRPPAQAAEAAGCYEARADVDDIAESVRGVQVAAGVSGLVTAVVDGIQPGIGPEPVDVGVLGVLPGVTDERQQPRGVAALHVAVQVDGRVPVLSAEHQQLVVVRPALPPESRWLSTVRGGLARRGPEEGHRYPLAVPWSMFCCAAYGSLSSPRWRVSRRQTRQYGWDPAVAVSAGLASHRAHTRDTTRAPRAPNKAPPRTTPKSCRRTASARHSGRTGQEAQIRTAAVRFWWSSADHHSGSCPAHAAKCHQSWDRLVVDSVVTLLPTAAGRARIDSGGHPNREHCH